MLQVFRLDILYFREGRKNRLCISCNFLLSILVQHQFLWNVWNAQSGLQASNHAYAHVSVSSPVPAFLQQATTWQVPRVFFSFFKHPNSMCFSANARKVLWFALKTESAKRKNSQTVCFDLVLWVALATPAR